MVALGAAFYGLFEPAHFSLVDAVYMAVISVTTVGFGDVSPQTPCGRAFACAYLLLSVTVVGRALGVSVDTFMERQQEVRREALLAKEFDDDDFGDADRDGDGLLTEPEYTLFMIERMQLVERSELERIRHQFRACDVDGDGALSLSEVRRRSPASVAPSAGGAAAALPGGGA